MPLCKPCKQCYTSISNGISYQNCISSSRTTPYITFPCVGGQEVETRICQLGGMQPKPHKNLPRKWWKISSQLPRQLPIACPTTQPPRKMRLTLGCCHPTDIHHSIDHLFPKKIQKINKCSTGVKTYLLRVDGHKSCFGSWNSPVILWKCWIPHFFLHCRFCFRHVANTFCSIGQTIGLSLQYIHRKWQYSIDLEKISKNMEWWWGYLAKLAFIKIVGLLSVSDSRPVQTQSNF